MGKINLKLGEILQFENELNGFTNPETGKVIYTGFLKQKINAMLKYEFMDTSEFLLKEKKNSLTHYPILGYWLDIGKHSDYLKAQEDIKHISIY